MIHKIKPEDLRRMKGKEGIILQGCGGDPQEWLDGINNILTEEKILLDGTRFSDVSVFENKGLTNILFPFDNSVHTDTGRLAVWRLATHNNFGGTWLTDYVENNLGGFENSNERIKPDCALIGQDGNIFNLMGIASHTLKQSGLKAEAKEMCDRIMSSGSYSEALSIIGDYVNITDGSESEDTDEDEGLEMSL